MLQRRTRERRLPAVLRLTLALVVLAATFALGGASAFAAGRHDGAVYTLTNDPAGNAVVAYTRGADGQLTPAGVYPTGGRGSGSGLGSEGAVTLSNDGRWLLAVNAGSDELSLFAVGGNGLTLSATVAAGGEKPISATISKDVVYVLNGGGAGNISGFHIEHGRLRAIAGSTQPLSGAGPAQVQFNPKGDALVVTEKATNTIDVYTVGRDGVASAPTAHASNGATPFGFDFTAQGTLVVSDAFGGAADASALSTYRLAGSDLIALDGPAATTETAACWVVTTDNGKYAYTTNTGSDSVSGFAVGRHGDLTLLTSGGKTGVAGGHPTDLALSDSGNSHYLYTLNSSDHTLSIFRVNNDGSLTSAGTLTGVPAGALGLAPQ